MPPTSDGKPSNLAGSSTDQAEQLARLYRICLDDGLSTATRLQLKELLIEELGAGAPAPAELRAPDLSDQRPAESLQRDPEPHPMERRAVAHPEPHPPERRAAHPEPHPMERRTAAHLEVEPRVEAARPREVESHEPPPPDASTPEPEGFIPDGYDEPMQHAGATSAYEASAEQLDMKLRQMVEADAPWELLEPVALALYDVDRSGGAAARIVELAFLTADLAALLDLLQRFKTEVPDFYAALHPTVRPHLLLRLWQQGASEVLAGLLFRERDAEFLQPLERLFVFLTLAEANDATLPFMYSQRYLVELLQAASDFGERLNLTVAQLRMHLGRLALDLGYHAEAVQILEPIPEAAPERDEALHLLLETSIDKQKNGRNTLIDQILRENAVQGRLQLLAQMLQQTRDLGGFKDRNRPALNELLVDPLAWLSEDAEVWATLSELLISSRDLEPLLPQLLQVFRSNAGRFHPPALDNALWQGPLQIQGGAPREAYWRGVALLHLYVNNGSSTEAELWQSYHLVEAAQQKSATLPPSPWKDLHKAAFAWVARSHQIKEVERTRMLRQLRIAAPEAQVTLNDLDDYATHEGTAPVAVLTSLQAIAEGKRAPALAQRFLLKRAQQNHLTNADLGRIWRLANDRQESDVAWRTATVLNARQALCSRVRPAWEISGEKRAQYTFYVPKRQILEHCLDGLTPVAARLAHACVQVGGVLPTLLAILDPGAQLTKLPQLPADSVEARVDRALNDIDWLPTLKKRYRFSFESALGGSPLPAFMQILPTNAWSLLTVRLADRLGVNAWGWRLSRLQSQIFDLIPRLASRHDMRRNSDRIATWLRELEPEQRAAWQDLAALTRSLDDQEAALAMASFICRLATVILQNHYVALTSLQTMRAHVAMIWDLEVWLLGDAYTKVRKEAGTESRVLVPSVLQRLPTIIAAPFGSTP